MPYSRAKYMPRPLAGQTSGSLHTIVGPKHVYACFGLRQALLLLMNRQSLSCLFMSSLPGLAQEAWL